MTLIKLVCPYDGEVLNMNTLEFNNQIFLFWWCRDSHCRYAVYTNANGVVIPDFDGDFSRPKICGECCFWCGRCTKSSYLNKCANDSACPDGRLFVDV